jgi:hypothetical protein
MQAVISKMFHVEKYMSVVERYLKTESLKTVHSDYMITSTELNVQQQQSLWGGSCETVQANKKCDHT